MHMDQGTSNRSAPYKLYKIKKCEFRCFCLQVSVGTLLAFTIVAVSILILRYIPPDEMPLPLSLQQSFDPAASQYDAQENKGEESRDGYRSCSDVNKQLQGRMLDPNDVEASTSCPLIMKENTHGNTKIRSFSFFSAISFLQRLIYQQ